MDQVLGIVHDDAGELDVLLGLEHEDVGDRLVQAVGLLVGPFVRHQHHVGCSCTSLAPAHLGRIGVVEINADEVMRVIVAHRAASSTMASRNVRRAFQHGTMMAIGRSGSCSRISTSGNSLDLLPEVPIGLLLQYSMSTMRSSMLEIADDHARDQHDDFDDVEILEEEGGGACVMCQDAW